jgi:hypothetical protein
MRNQAFWNTTDMNDDDLIYRALHSGAKGMDNTH